jgi:battenin
VAFWFNFTLLMGNPSLSREQVDVDVAGNIGRGEGGDNKEDLIRKLSSDQPSHGASSLATRGLLESGAGTDTSSTVDNDDDGDGDGTVGIMAPKKRAAMEAATLVMTTRERFDNTLALWPYMVPLFVVFYSEYVIQSGVWSAMGFPPSDKDARAKFYSYSNWCYQAGVLVSRSSGTTFTASMELLWLMPLIQAGMLLFFTLEAFFLFWNEWSLLPVCFCVGLLGGAVYVQGFAKISEGVPLHLKEFSLSAASVADSTGTTLATVTGIFVQQAIYNYHNLKDDDD